MILFSHWSNWIGISWIGLLLMVDKVSSFLIGNQILAFSRKYYETLSKFSLALLGQDMPLGHQCRSQFTQFIHAYIVCLSTTKTH